MSNTKPAGLHDQVFPILRKNKGNVTATCRELSIARDTFYKWIAEDDHLRAQVNSIENIQKDIFLDILNLTNGILLTACRTLGISRTIVYEWMATDHEFKRQVDDIREFSKDFVESKLFEGIKAGNTQLIMFYLSRIARDRGYIEKTEMEHTFAGKTITIGFSDEDQDSRS